MEKHGHQPEPLSPSQPQSHLMPPCSAQLNLVVLSATTARSRAVMDVVRCQDGDAQRARIKTGRAGWNSYGQKSLPALLRPPARGWLTNETPHPMKEEKESALMGLVGEST